MGSARRRNGAHGPSWPCLSNRFSARSGPLSSPTRGSVTATAALWTDDSDCSPGNGTSIAAGLGNILRPAEQIRRELQAAACPLTFEDIGVSPDRAREAVLFSRHIRTRYTILDLLDEARPAPGLGGSHSPDVRRDALKQRPVLLRKYKPHSGRPSLENQLSSYT